MTQVESCWALGSVFAIHLVAQDGTGYNSSAAEEFLRRLKEDGQWNAHARALGSVVYVIAGLKTKSEVIEGMQEMLVRALAG
jgi:dethiobiotin synthetase/adenosylmethionine--8-amino-7-oxononanoate aminotransferase